MNEIWLTSDTHFGHDKDFVWNARGFENIEQHNQEIIKRWNEVVKKDDIVYHLGDVMLGDLEAGIECLKQLNGQIKIVLGNHDTKNRVKAYKELDNVEVLGYTTILKYKKYHFYLSHYPTLTDNMDEDKPLKARVLNLYGHTHQTTKFLDEQLNYHVGIDTHGRPIKLDNIIEEIKERKNEINS